MKKYLVTGGAGFIGSNFIAFLLDQLPDCEVINLDLLTYAGREENMTSFRKDPRHHFVKGDICDRKLVDSIFDEFDFSGVFHFAAESHVDNSISGPEAFVRTNVDGTFTLLDVARNRWMEGPGVYRKGLENRRFLHVSTDEVYGSLGPTGLFTEKTPYAPNSPYSASKAGADFIVRSYFHTYGMNVVTTNCSNNYGPNQHDEKLIPTIIRNALRGNPIPIYGDGQNVRDWLYVEDHCRGVLLAFQKGRAGETYNIGGRNERNNLYIAQTICERLDHVHPTEASHTDLITFVADRPGHDRRYAIDASKIEKELGWEARENFETGIVKTIEHYIDKYTENGSENT